MITDRKLTIAVSGLKKVENDHGIIGICDLVFSDLFVVRCVRIERKDDYTMLRFPYWVGEDLLGCQKRLLDVCPPCWPIPARVCLKEKIDLYLKKEWTCT